MPDYTLRPSLEQANLDDYVTLFGHAFGGDDKLSRTYLAWQYCDNPHGRVIGMDAFAGDVLVAHYAIIPRRYRLGSTTIPAALSVNTATHPDHQGKGLFVRLANETYRRAAESGVHFVIGVANANSVGGFLRRLGFTELGQVRLHLFAPAVPADTAALDLDRDAAFVAWRLANPSRSYRARRRRDGSQDLFTTVKRVNFRLGQVPADAATGISLPAAGLLPALTPAFGPASPGGLRLPLRAQPSPWHVIWKTLDPAVDASLPGRLRLDGLAMDTF